MDKTKAGILKQFRSDLDDSEIVLVGIGSEWSIEESKAVTAYNVLYELIKEKDYFIVTTVTDGLIYKSRLNPLQIVAPCGNRRWRQCSESCTKDIWEEEEVLYDICPHCKAPLTGNTIEAKEYIEEGYLPQWNAYTLWLSQTLNRKLLILELGEGFKTPTVIRWPFEKVAYLNQKALMYRIHETFAQPSEELKGKMTVLLANSIEFVVESEQ